MTIRNIFKKISFVLLTIIITICLTSCGVSMKKAEKVTKAELENKYNEEFVIDSSTLKSQTYDFF
jgi:hypothetical protein